MKPLEDAVTIPALKTRAEASGAPQERETNGQLPQTFHVWLPSCRAFGAGAQFQNKLFDRISEFKFHNAGA